MRGLRFGLVLGVALLAAACLPVTTTVPVGTTVGLSADPGLIGTWKVIPQKEKNGKTDDGGPGYIHFIVAKDGIMTALAISTGKLAPEKSEGDWSVFAASATTLGGHHYLNVRPTFDSGKAATDKDARNIPMLYRFGHRGRLTLYMIGEDAAAAAIKAGKIEGIVDQDKFGDVTITAPADKLDAFLASKDGAALFTEKLLEMKRVR